MMEILDDEIYACGNCLMVIACGDYDGMSQDEVSATDAGIAELVKATGGHLVAGEYDYGFCHCQCDICSTGLSGNRHQVVLLSA